MFRDITTLLKDPQGFKETIDLLHKRYANKKIDKVIGIESRGFIFGAPLAYLLGCGFVPIRKRGKLPAECASEEYTLEYGKDKIEVHKDAISNGDRILIVDDLIATAGTAMPQSSSEKPAKEAGRRKPPMTAAPTLPYRPRDPQRYRPGIGLVGCGGITPWHLTAYRGAGYEVLDLITFFTITGGKVVRAWSVQRGTKAAQAAGKVHTQMEKGFIKAEVLNFEQLVEVGDWHAARERGILRTEGRDYVMQDGDVCLFRFSP